MTAFFESWLVPLMESYGLLAVFISMILESACIPIPSEIVVPFGGFLAAQGHASLWQVVLVASVANLIGSTIAYAVGRYGGRALVLRYGRYILMSPHHLELADRWFEKRGPITVFLTRMMPGVRTFISLPAGIMRMPFAKFALYTFLGALPWNAALAFLGWQFGANWDRLQGYFHRYDLVFYAVLGVLVVLAVAWKWRGVRRSKSASLQKAAEE